MAVLTIEKRMRQPLRRALHRHMHAKRLMQSEQYSLIVRWERGVRSEECENILAEN